MTSSNTKERFSMSQAGGSVDLSRLHRGQTATYQSPVHLRRTVRRLRPPSIVFCHVSVTDGDHKPKQNGT